MEENKFNVLDDGFVRLVDHFGSDEDIAQAARVSYAKGTKTVQEDADLVRYLMKHEHYSPFAMCQIKLHVRLPIFVHNQFIRHQNMHWNVQSGRYSIMPDEKWMSNSEWRKPSSTNKQAGEEIITETLLDIWTKLDYIPTTMDGDDSAQSYADMLQKNSYEHSQLSYERLLKMGVCREQARTVLPMGQYTEAFVTANLGDWMLFLRRRMDSHAQKEIQVYANAIFDILNKLYPAAMQAFIDYQYEAVNFSKMEMSVLKEIITKNINFFQLDASDRVELLERHGLTSKRDRIEFFQKLNVS